MSNIFLQLVMKQWLDLTRDGSSVWDELVVSSSGHSSVYKYGQTGGEQNGSSSDNSSVYKNGQTDVQMNYHGSTS